METGIPLACRFSLAVCDVPLFGFFSRGSFSAFLGINPNSSKNRCYGNTGTPFRATGNFLEMGGESW
jgi:hypothetical protein